MRYTWDVRDPWALAEGLPVEAARVEDLPGIDENCWLHDGAGPTVRNVVLHTRRILAAHLERPIVLNVDASVMDGLHRVARALFGEWETLPAGRSPTLPPTQGVERVPSDGDTSDTSHR